jgi:hypothetical protein
MKIILLATLSLTPLLVFAAPKPAETGPTRQELLQTVDHIVRLSQDLQNTLNAEKAAHKGTETGLQEANLANAALQKQIDKNTRDCNKRIDQLNSAVKKLSWYRWHWWGSWIVFGLGVVAVGFFAFLKFTGRLAAVAAKL